MLLVSADNDQQRLGAVMTGSARNVSHLGPVAAARFRCRGRVVVPFSEIVSAPVPEGIEPALKVARSTLKPCAPSRGIQWSA